MTSNEMLDYIINSERWGEPTCVEEATKNHEIEKWLRKQIEINEIFKKHIKKPQFTHSFKAVDTGRRIKLIENKEQWVLSGFGLLFNEEEKNKIEGWLNEI